MEIRVATRADLPAMSQTLAGAFYDDPVWSWAFPDPTARHRQHAIWWRFYLESALRYDWVRLIDGGAAVALWIPPAGVELTPDETERIEPLLRELVGPWADQVLEGLARFDAALPDGQPFYYLTLWGTSPARQGEGVGTRLLRDNLERIDGEHMPCYLESTNPTNDARYARLGFEPHGEFAMPDGGPVVTTMWRAPR